MSMKLAAIVIILMMMSLIMFEKNVNDITFSFSCSKFTMNNFDVDKFFKFNIMSTDQLGHSHSIPLAIYEPSGTITGKQLRAHVKAVVGYEPLLIQIYAQTKDNKLVVNIFACLEYADENGEVFKYDQVKGYFCAPIMDNETLILPINKCPVIAAMNTTSGHMKLFHSMPFTSSPTSYV